MSKYVAPVVFCLFAFVCSIAGAQNICPVNIPSDKLICLIPQAFGPAEALPLTSQNASQFPAEPLNRQLRPLDSAVARESVLLPIASPSSGITFVWDAGAKIQVPATDSFGPILGERAQTIGRHLLFLGFDYQYFKFDSLDDVNLKKLPVVLTQADDSSDVTNQNGSPRTCAWNGDNIDACAFIRDITTTSTRLDLKIHQFTTFITFGLTSRIDVSAVIPIENIRMGVFSTATIHHNDIENRIIHALPPNPPKCPAPCLDASFTNIGVASGIGDITLRMKAVMWQGEKSALAVGTDVRFPTGDKLNFLGSGAIGVKPFIVLSFLQSRVSPHVSVGYGINGSSVIAGDISVGEKERLPDQLTYAGGLDIWFTKWFTGAFDLVGQQVFQTKRTSLASFKEPGACNNAACTDVATPIEDSTLSQQTGSYNNTNAAIGFKIRPFSRRTWENLLVTGNVLVKINDGGLRSKFIPLVGISYTFGPKIGLDHDRPKKGNQK